MQMDENGLFPEIGDRDATGKSWGTLCKQNEETVFSLSIDPESPNH